MRILTAEQTTFFKQSTDGILNHDGTIKVCKNFDVMQEIVETFPHEIHVKNKKGNKYIPQIHKDLDITFAEKGDIAFVKFKAGTPYIIGFRKEMKK